MNFSEKTRVDVLLLDGDIQIENGDIAVCSSEPATQQQMALLLYLQKGDLHYDIELGVGIRGSINGVRDERLKRRIQLNLAADGFEARAIRFLGDDKISILIK